MHLSQSAGAVRMCSRDHNLQPTLYAQWWKNTGNRRSRANRRSCPYRCRLPYSAEALGSARNVPSTGPIACLNVTGRLTVICVPATSATADCTFTVRKIVVHAQPGVRPDSFNTANPTCAGVIDQPHAVTNTVVLDKTRTRCGEIHDVQVSEEGVYPR